MDRLIGIHTGAWLGSLLIEASKQLPPNGNTGEFYALSRDECNPAVEVSADAVEGRVLLLPGVGYDIGAGTYQAQQTHVAPNRDELRMVVTEGGTQVG